MMSFTSFADLLAPIEFPVFGPVGVLMMPINVNDLDSVPRMVDGEDLSDWRPAIAAVMGLVQTTGAQADPGWPICYLTIDASVVQAGATHRRPGLHVDGRHGHLVRGIITAADVPGCLVYRQSFVGEPAVDGDCDHLAGQCRPESAEVLQAGMAHYLDGSCVHRSMPQPETVARQMIRLTLPGQCWHANYTRNPLGVRHFGDTLPARSARIMGHRQLVTAS